MSMRPGFWIARLLKWVVFIAVAVGVFSFVVMSLWNWLMPSIFGARPIGVWQAFGLLILSRILFGGFRGGWGGRGRWRYRMMERWNQMTPEEREKFQAGLQARCGRGERQPTGMAL